MRTSLLTIILFFTTGNINSNSKALSFDNFYFPPNNSNEWETISRKSLNWDEGAIKELQTFLKSSNTKSFLILVNGRIALEQYFDDHNISSNWQWNSAGKTLISTLTGIAQQNGLLNINDRVSNYLGPRWTNEPQEKEKLITIHHLLSMTSGINDSNSLVKKRNLTYVADAGARWAYSNVFQKQMDVIARASRQDFEKYFDDQIKSKIGMDGYWRFGIVFNIYHSTARSMARFGLLALNNGKWKNEQIVNSEFHKQAISSSQNINPAYGYFWWLNGKNKYMTPAGQNVYSGKLIENAPADLYAAMGAGDQRIYIIPSKKMVIIRMGKSYKAKQNNFALSDFDNLLWTKINPAIN